MVHVVLENLQKQSIFTRKHSSIPAIILVFVLRAWGSGSRQFRGPRRRSRRTARGPRRAGPGRGRGGGGGAPGRRALPEVRPGALGNGGGAHARCEFPHLDEPAKDAEEPVLAVDRAADAVSSGHLLLLVLVPTGRRRRGIAIHDTATDRLQELRRKPPEEARGRLAPRGPGAPGATPATATPAARGLPERPLLCPSCLGAQKTYLGHPTLPRTQAHGNRGIHSLKE